jgi:signal transduction histidine kinase
MMVLGQEVASPLSVADPAVPRVLVVDDEETVMLTIQGVLQLDGYAVTATSSGERALELLSTQHFDVLLTDLRLDAVGGIDLLRETRSQSPDTVSIMLTGYASLETAVAAMREGAYDYLFKPCDVAELRRAVAHAIERGRMAVELRNRIRDLEQANETIRHLNLELETRVKQATAELRDQITSRDEFMAAVSHDLKSPLTFIKGMAHLRRRRAPITPETEPLVEALAQIEASAGRMALQLDELVDASRLQAGRPLELRRGPTDLIALANNAVAEHQHMTERHVLRISTARDQLVGNWDAIRLRRVFDNLLDNALKFSPRGGAVEVSIDLEGDSAVVSVSDVGEGIPEADLPYVFERFRRGQNVEGRIPGSGIGLAGVHAIVELHRGTISVQSKVGQGTVFIVRLPINVDGAPF